MKTLHDLFVAVRSQEARGDELRFHRDVIPDILAILSEAIRTTGGDRPEPGSVYARLARLERQFRDEDGDWVDEPWRAIAERVSEGAQRDSSDLHMRVAFIEKRLIPPNPDGSWALLTTPEATTAIERLETEIADFRKHDGTRREDHRQLWQAVHKAEALATAADARSQTIITKVSAMDRGMKQLQAQWDNIRKRLKALLSSDS